MRLLLARSVALIVNVILTERRWRRAARPLLVSDIVTVCVPAALNVARVAPILTGFGRFCLRVRFPGTVAAISSVEA